LWPATLVSTIATGLPVVTSSTLSADYADSSMTSETCWMPATDAVNGDEYIFVNLIYPRYLMTLKTKGSAGDNDDWTKKYKLEYSTDADTWEEYESGAEFDGNDDKDTEVEHDLAADVWSMVSATYLKLIPTEFEDEYPCLRWELTIG